MPWDVAGMFGVLAAEEFRVNRISQVLVEHTLTATYDNGNAVTLADVLGGWYLDALAKALDVLVPGVSEVVHDYRNYRMDLDAMWTRVAQVSEELMLLCAHADAHYPGDGLMLDALPPHSARQLLELCWQPVSAYLHESPVVPERDKWAVDRSRIVELSRDGWMTTWERLGLRPSPSGDSFYIAVEAPHVS
jgi:hypothetical protein